MNLCANKHDEVCFEEWSCPVCREREQHEDDVADLQEQIKELKEQLKAANP